MNRRNAPTLALLVLVLAASGCTSRKGTDGGHGHDDGHDHEHSTWSVTSWGERYEIFAEVDPLTVGETAKAHTHVTVLDGSQPLAQGRVTAFLVGSDGSRTPFEQSTATRAGIFSIEIRPEVTGRYGLVFRVEGSTGVEEIPSGRVFVSPTHETVGGLVEPPAARPGGPGDDAIRDAGDAVSFLKEEQWRVPFATDWTRTGTVRPSVSGAARVRPAAGGEAVLTAPLDGVVVGHAGLFVGRGVGRGDTVVELRPRAASGRSLVEIEAESRLATERLARLEDLYAAEAVSRAELDRARAQAATLRAEWDAVGGTGRTVTVAAPFDGRIAEVLVTAGEAVTAGDRLARLVRPEPLWVEVGLRPESAVATDGSPVGLIVQRGPLEAPLEFGPGAVRLVSRSPELDRATGLVQVTLEVRGGMAKGLRPGTIVQAEILLPGRRDGIVVPAEAVVDDAGVPVVYVQTEGESFLRREVVVTGRQGDRVLVEGVKRSDRVVTRGAAAIRRSAQMSSGAVEGHVY